MYIHADVNMRRTSAGTILIWSWYIAELPVVHMCFLEKYRGLVKSLVKYLITGVWSLKKNMLLIPDNSGLS